MIVVIAFSVLIGLTLALFFLLSLLQWFCWPFCYFQLMLLCNVVFVAIVVIIIVIVVLMVVVVVVVVRLLLFDECRRRRVNNTAEC